MRLFPAALCCALLFTALTGRAADGLPSLPRSALVIEPVGRYGRAPFNPDPIQLAIASGSWQAPAAGGRVLAADGRERTWSSAELGEDGGLRHDALRGGYVFVQVESGEPAVVLLRARGHNMVYVNGEPRGGDPYQSGVSLLPVQLRAGSNDLLFHCSRGALSVRFEPAPAGAALSAHDTILPDLVIGEPADVVGAVHVINPTGAVRRGLSLVCRMPGGESVSTAVGDLAPLGVLQAPFRARGSAAAEGGSVSVSLSLVAEGSAAPLAELTVELNVRAADAVLRRTFISEIDGSAQYYAVLAARPQPGDPPPALVLTLHGAGVEAHGQAASYAARPWAHIVAPTNRRPFGFDWEDWGRWDALEVLADAQSRLAHDPRRVLLTGHSMGGHGAWHLGVSFPERFAAIGPSAGWASFWSYTGAARYENATRVEQLLMRATNPSDTMALARNLAPRGIYILHGDADDNVPPDQARRMRDLLADFHRDLHYHEQSGAGHWWDDSDAAGVGCVDWPPMFDLFARRRLPAPAEVRDVSFVTASPGVSSRVAWAEILAQERSLDLSRVELRCDPWERRFTGTTENVRRLALDLSHLPRRGTLTLRLDGQSLEEVAWPEGDTLHLERHLTQWSTRPPPSAELKGPHRQGPFKEAFRNRVLLVYGTRGTPEENGWALAKARYDAETFAYRGNGRLECVADADFDAARQPDGNVVLYGNARTNGAWEALLGESPVQVRPGAVQVGARVWEGEDLACLLVRPRPGSARGLVGAVGGSGPVGMRLTDRLPWFVSGVAYPDFVVFGPQVLAEGTAGVRATGYFGHDWELGTGDTAWSDEETGNRE